MRAARHMMEYLARNGATACFANPGTSEMHLVSALDAAPGIRPVLCLFEGVATGAADGFGRMARRPALTLLHLGPGLGNGLANLHNAYRARTPILSLIGEHATYHRANNPPLASDIAALARPVSTWVETAEAATTLTTLAAKGFAVALDRGPAALILPADIGWSDEEPVTPAPVMPAPQNRSWTKIVDDAAKLLRAGKAVLLIGGRHVSARACRAARRIGERTSAKVFIETFPARIERGGDAPALMRLPYLTEMAVGVLADASAVITVGASAPIAFFALPNRATRLAPEDAPLLQYVEPGAEIEAALVALAETLGSDTPAVNHDQTAIGVPNADARLDALGLAQTLAATMPAHAIVSDESITLGLNAFDCAAGAPEHDWLSLTGGSIGQGLPLATGAAVACPERRVIALEGDGSALYTPQALWTQAREQLNVTNIILNNGAYAILNLEMMRTGVADIPNAARALFDLRRPAISFTQLAAGFGVPAQQVHTVHELAAALRRSFATPGPYLIETMFA